MEHFELVVIGAGPGGYVAAIRATQLGIKTAIVDKRPQLGGTCMNIGCIPSKALLHSSELFVKIRNEGSTHGIKMEDLQVDLQVMQKRKKDIVDKLGEGIAQLMKHNKITVFTGVGHIEDTETVTVETGKNRITLKSDRILLATGGVAQRIPNIDFDGNYILSSTEALELNSVPPTLLVIGGGAIGLEIGSIWNRLGSKVTVIEAMPEILPGWDLQVAQQLRKSLTAQGISFMLDCKAESATVKNKKVHLKTHKKDLVGDKLLVAIGRTPHLQGYNLENLNLEMDGNRIKVDANYRSSVPGVYAIGDIIQGPMLAHKASEEGIVAIERMKNINSSIQYEFIPNIVYTHPEVAFVGRSEDQLKKEGREYHKSTARFSTNGRALTMNLTEGMVKILADKTTDKILGVHIIGSQASDLIGEAVSVMEFSGSAEDISRIVHSHPTLAETLKEAALGIQGRKIHGA